MGLEIPITAPEEERWDQALPVLGSCNCCSFFWARRRRQIDIRSAAIAPKRAPGKNPASTALLGKEGHDTVVVRELVVSFEEEADGDETGVKVAAGVSVVVLEVVMASVVAVLLFRTQVFFAAQE